MSCRKAYETDLAEFTLEPSAATFDDFRRHLAGCAECRAEVDVWADLGRQLASVGEQPAVAHPSADLLLRFDEGVGLSSEERRRVERHLPQCPACRDELRSLARFDFSSLAEVPAKHPVSRRRTASRLASWLGRVVAHPAFAYGLVVLLMLPTILTRFGVLPEVSPSIEHEPMAHHGRQDAAGIDDSLGSYQARGSASSPDIGEAKFARGVGAAQPLHAEKMEAFFPDENAKQEVREPPVRLDEVRKAKEVAPRHRTAGQVKPAAPLRQLREGTVPLPASFIAPATVRIHLPAGTRAGAPVDVRVASLDGWRELRQRVVPVASTDEIEVVLPNGWISDGRSYRVELQSVPASEGAEPLAVYEITLP